VDFRAFRRSGDDTVSGVASVHAGHGIFFIFLFARWFVARLIRQGVCHNEKMGNEKGFLNKNTF
jgi:hypothetical protein